MPCSLEKRTWKEDALQGESGAHTEAFVSLNPCLTVRSFSTSYHRGLPFVKERGRVTAPELNQEEPKLTSPNPFLTARSFSTSYHRGLPFVKERVRVIAPELNQEEARSTSLLVLII